MKLMKKIAMLLLSICLVVPCFAMVSYAENNGIRFNDPSTKVGETVTVTVNMQANAAVENINITFAYDTEYLKFVGGDNFTEVSEGTLVYDYKINAASLSEKVYFSMQFQALKVGTASVTIKEQAVTSNPSISWKLGNSKITIAEGEGGITSVEPEEPTQEPTEEPSEAPSETTGAEIKISNTTTITLIEDVSSIVLPERYAETTVTMNGAEFAAWRDSKDSNFYILYASNAEGESSLYRYDIEENTYQRFTVEEEKKDTEGITAFLGENTDYVVLAGGVLLLVLVIAIIVLSVKLYNRNAELDELYDEYGIDLDDEEEEEEKKEAKKAPKKEEKPVEDEDDPEVEVEFFVQDSVKEFFEEEKEVAVEVAEKEETQVTKAFVVEDVKPAKPVVEEFYDDDMDEDFEINFIDLED